MDKELQEYRGTNLMKQNDIDKIADEMVRRKEYLEKINSKLYVVVYMILESLWNGVLTGVDKSPTDGK